MGNAYVWGRLANKSMTGNQEYPRLMEDFYRKHIFIGAVVCGFTHFAFLADTNLTEVLAALLACCTTSNVDLGSIKGLLNSVPSGLVKPIQDRVHNWLHEDSAKDIPLITVDYCIAEITPKEMKQPQEVSAFMVVSNFGDKKTSVTVSTSVKELYQSEKYLISFSPDKFVLGPRQFETIQMKVECRKNAIERLTSIYSLLAQHEAVGKNKAKAANYFIMCQIKPIRTASRMLTKTYESRVDLVRALESYVPLVIVNDHAGDYTIPTDPVIYQFKAAILFIDVSGFTSLNERLQRLGSAGPEQVSTHLNSYFGKLIEAVNGHGGDVLKFAGDALICMFGDKREAEPLDVLTVRATQCALQIQIHLSEYDSKEGFTLTLHIGIGAGKLYALYVGGIQDHWEFLVVGDPLLQLKTTVENSKSGEVVVSKEAYELIQEKVVAEPRGPDDFLIKSLSASVERKPAVIVPAALQLEQILRCFIPQSVLIRLDSNQEGWLAELRRVTVLFIKLTSLTYEQDKPLAFEKIQEVFCYMQSVIFRYEGMIRQFLVDDKGTVLIAAFGVPPLSHEDDPVRGIKVALDIHSKLKGMGTQNAIGVTTGNAFCGSVGSRKRQEYAMVGDIVNLSARLMGVAEKQSADILCDEATYEASVNHPASRGITFQQLPAVYVKVVGNALLSIFSPFSQYVLSVLRAKQMQFQSSDPLNNLFSLSHKSLVRSELQAQRLLER
jgi:class 3 adenylate cyclase